MNTTIRNARIAIGALTLGAITVASAVPVQADGAPGNPDAAVYEGSTLDLSESWGTAGACVELTSTTECYDTEAELLAAHPELSTFVTATKGRPASRPHCSPIARARCSSTPAAATRARCCT